MKKLLTRMMLLLCALMAGSSSVWASTYTTTFSRSSSKLSCTGDVTYSTTKEPSGNGDSNRGVQFGSSGSPAGSFTLTAGTSINNITKVVVACCTGSGGSATVNVKVGEANMGSSKTISPNTTSADNYTFDGSTLSGIVTITVNATSKAFFLKSVTITYTEVTDLTTFAFSNTAPSVTLGKNKGKYEANYSQSVTVAPNDYTGTITYAFDEENSTFDVENDALIDDETGEIIISAAANLDADQTIVVKASGTATSSYNEPDDATYTLTVHPAPAGVGTPEFSLAAGSYYYGTTVSITSTNASNIYYTTNGTTPSSSNGTLYSGSVVINADMTLKAIGYDGETASSVASVDYTLKAPEAPTFSVAAGAVSKGTTVTITPGEGGSTVLYTTDGTTPSWSSSNGEEGTSVTINYGQTIKAITVDDGENESTVVSATYTLTIPTGSVYYELLTDASDLSDGDKILIVDADINYTMNTTSTGNNRPQVAVTTEEDGTIKTLPATAQVVTLEADGDNWYFNVGSDAYLYAASSSSNQLKTASKATVGNNGKATISISNEKASIVFQGTATRNDLRYNSSSSLFSCYESGKQGDIKIYVQKTEDPTETEIISSHGWATYIPSYAVQFPANRAFIVSGIDEGKTELAAVTKVPARTPVLLKGEGEVTINILNETVDAPTENLLSIGTGTTPTGMYPYVLAKDGDGKAGFKRWTGAASTLKNRVVMLLDYSVSAREFFFFDNDDETTGINDSLVKGEKVDSAVYNLAGQRVAQPTKGLYIVNGKKVVIK